MRHNIITKTDSYKWTQCDMLPDGTTRGHSYMEARPGGAHDAVRWFGLQYYLKEYLEGAVVTRDMLEEALAIDGWHFSKHQLDMDAWYHVIARHAGRLPLRICAAPEGLVVPVGNVLMTVETTDPRLPWLDSHVESLLLKAWYSTEVATVSWYARQEILSALDQTGGDPALADYMLHDFGYRGVSSEESAAIGGAAHLLSFKGTDTMEGMRLARHYYGAGPGVGQSVVAAQHSIMTALGEEGEITQALRIIARHPNGIVSLPGDSYNYERFVDHMIDHRADVERHGVRLVIRPDSVTRGLPTPRHVVLWTLKRMATRIGQDHGLPLPKTSTGHLVTPYGVLYGDAVEPKDIGPLHRAVREADFAAQNVVLGMGGGLLQKVNRDSDRFAFKSSAQERDGKWHDISKRTPGKPAKAGRLQLFKGHAGYYTAPAGTATLDDRVLRPVFENGVVLAQDTFETVQTRGVPVAKPVMV